MLVIGLTGSLATGKSTVAAMFKKLGAKVLDADKIAHQGLKKGMPSSKAILKQFGEQILTKGHIDRKKLADLVFKDQKKLKKLTGIIYPLVIQEIQQKISVLQKKRKKQVLVIDAPMLIEAGLTNLVDVVIVVKANRKKQLARILRTTAMSQAEALRRIKMQMPIKEKIRLSDIVIDNRGSLRQTQRQVHTAFHKILNH